MDLDLKTQVKLFLLSFRELFDSKKISYEFNRKSSLYFRKIGWVNTHAARYAREHIDISNYSEGPSPHHFKDDTMVAVFGLHLEGEELYIKISIDKENCGCMSFHPAERPMNYPLREMK